MFWLKKLIFIVVPILQKGQNINQNYYKLIIKDNQNACVEAKINKNIAKRFDASIGYCKNIGCNEYKGKQYIPFCCVVKGYVCNHFNYSKN
tara:strand:- start:791 stop:1063 length:273 start_codon:yes stop_codon:yes gene_type:complete